MSRLLKKYRKRTMNLLYITIYGKFMGKYIESKGGVYWLTEKMAHEGTGYALLKKTYKGTYEAIKILKINGQE